MALTVACIVLCGGCASGGGGTQAGERASPFPNVRVDVKGKVVEFDGVVPIDPHDRETPLMFLEVVVCSRDSREHESLVVTDAVPSHVHAALLMIGAEPGRPGSWKPDPILRKMVPTAPVGPEVEVEFIHTGLDGAVVHSNPSDWIIDVRNHRSLRTQARGEPVWLFGGSAIAPRPDGEGEYYKADIEGTLIGLATFGTETLAWPHVFSPEAAVQAPEWIADAAKVPPLGTKVTVRLHLRMGVVQGGGHAP